MSMVNVHSLAFLTLSIAATFMVTYMRLPSFQMVPLFPSELAWFER